MSKAYGVIRRFSEDVDLTYDIRAIAADLVGDADAPLPASKSQEKKWSKEIRTRLSDWVGAEIVPRLKRNFGAGSFVSEL
ncbi:MAG: nucleotidyl transferase AbiEii/AbiGii toxin family protein [Ferrovum myxofaciens]